MPAASCKMNRSMQRKNDGELRIVDFEFRIYQAKDQADHRGRPRTWVFMG